MSTSPYSYAYLLSKNTYNSVTEANNVGIAQGSRVVYAKSSTLSSGDILYGDSRLTQPVFGNDTDWSAVQLLTNENETYAVAISTEAIIAVD